MNNSSAGQNWQIIPIRFAVSRMHLIALPVGAPTFCKVRRRYLNRAHLSELPK
jgi:hypothetical protein